MCGVTVCEVVGLRTNGFLQRLDTARRRRQLLVKLQQLKRLQCNLLLMHSTKNLSWTCNWRWMSQKRVTEAR